MLGDRSLYYIVKSPGSPSGKRADFNANRPEEGRSKSYFAEAFMAGFGVGIFCT